MSSPSGPSGSTRRTFVRQGVVGAAGMGLISMSARSATAAPGANERINLGLIGVGGRGTAHLNDLLRRAKDPESNLQVRAVCDIYERRKKAARERSGATPYHDYKELLDDGDINAVVISSPDHWHAPMAIDACRAGKDVYLEKPMTLTIDEARQVRDVVRKTDRVMQVGVQTTSDDKFWVVNEYVKRGLLGKLIWSQGGYPRNVPIGDWNYYKIWPDANESTVDWKAFLGSAPKRPFDADRYFRWRKYWDYSGGVATDLLYHALAHMSIALGPEFPLQAVASGGKFIHKEKREVPDTYLTTITFPTEHAIFLFSTAGNEQGIDEVYRGQEGSISLGPQGKGTVQFTPEKPFEKLYEERKSKGLFDIPSNPNRPNHMSNFLECVRTRNKPHCHAELGYRVMASIGLGVEAYRRQKTLRFDPKSGAIREA